MNSNQLVVIDEQDLIRLILVKFFFAKKNLNYNTKKVIFFLK